MRCAAMGFRLCGVLCAPHSLRVCTGSVRAEVSSITFKGETLDIPVDPDDPEAGLGPLARFFHDEIVGIQRGRIPSPWSAVIP